MGDTLVFSSQKGAYTLTDEGTFLAFKSQLSLVPLVTKGGSLLNRYSAIAVNPAKNPNVNIVQADRFINWLISDEGYEDHRRLWQGQVREGALHAAYAFRVHGYPLQLYMLGECLPGIISTFFREQQEQVPRGFKKEGRL